jgi:threonine/homoserine/homoserine lactone efflux protein
VPKLDAASATCRFTRQQARGRSCDGRTPALAYLSARRAALVGVLTHKPGLFYLAALSAITNSTSSNANRILQVVLYNAIWFAMPMAALALARRRPVELQDFLQRTTEWVWRHQREIMIMAFGILGVYLIVRGVVELRS